MLIDKLLFVCVYSFPHVSEVGCIMSSICFLLQLSICRIEYTTTTNDFQRSQIPAHLLCQSEGTSDGVRCRDKHRRLTIHAREGHQRALVGKPPHIADLRHELWSGDLACALHFHDVADVSLAAFSDAYRKWCTRSGYRFSQSDAERLHAAARNSVATFPKNDSTKLLITQAVDSLNAVYDALYILRGEIGTLGLAVKKGVDARKCLIQQRDQAVAEDHAGFLGA